MRLRCVSRYRTAKLRVEPGTVLDLSEAEAAALQADAPGCWEDADTPSAKAVEAPPADKMIRGAPKHK